MEGVNRMSINIILIII